MSKINDINILGTKENVTPILLKEWNMNCGKFNNIEEVIATLPYEEHGFKPIADELRGLIGTYAFTPLIKPKWFVEAMEEFNEWIDENLKDEEERSALFAEIDKYNETKVTTPKTPWFIKAIEQYQTITIDGANNLLFPNGTKVVKFLKKVSELTVGKEVDFMKSNCVRILESNKVESGEDIKIIFSSSTVSIMGMSEYFDGSLTSCQQYSQGKNTNHAKTINNNLYDPNSIICYVANSSTKKIPLRDSLIKHKDETEHKIMKQRMMVRLVKLMSSEMLPNSLYLKGSTKVVKEGQLGIMVDRSYPESKYNNQIYKIIGDYCKENGLLFLEPTSFNEAREKSYGQSIYTKDSSSSPAFDAYPFSVISCKRYVGEQTECNDNKNESMCKSCKPINSEICGVCVKNFDFKETKTNKCGRCFADSGKCPFIDKKIECCNCPLNRDYNLFGYKDNANGVDIEKRITINGLIADSYKVSILTEK